MARQTSMLTFTGRLGKLSGFRRNGKYYVRERPNGIHHTSNMKRAAQRFGRASRTGAFIRKALEVNGDGGHVNRITRALIPSGGCDLNQLAGVQFNQSQRTYSHFSTLPVLRDNGVLHIPPQVFPQRGYLEIKLIVVRVDLQTRKVLGRNTAVINIDTSQKFSGAELCADVPGTGTLIIALSVNNSAEIIAVENTQVAFESSPIASISIPGHVTTTQLIVLLE